VKAQSLHTETASTQPSEPGRIRLLKVLTTFFHGGTERQVLNLARGLDRQQFDLGFSCLRKEGDYLPAFEALQAPISEYRIKQLYHPQTFRQQLRFAARLRKQRLQILHSYNFYANVFAVPAARMAGVPVVLASVRDRGVYLSPAQKRLQRRVLGLADQVLVNADSIRDWLLEQGLAADRITVIKNGIDLAPFPENPPPSGVRQELGIPATSPIVMLLARLNPQKGVDDFIKAAARIAPNHPDARFVIVGSNLQYADGVSSEHTDYRESLQQLANSLGIAEKVIFTGHRDDAPALLAEAAISVLPSLSEGLSNTLLESMAAGVPTVATDVGGNPELVKEGVNGKLVPVQSPEQLARAIGSLLADPEQRRRLGAQARDMACTEYALPVMVAKTQQLYRTRLQDARRSLAWR
jgi:glycosyltransferase involved in cell wall biosynthesis